MKPDLNMKVIHDGARNAIVDIGCVLDESNLEPTVVVDIAKLFAEQGYKITKLRIEDVEYFVDPGLSVELLWEGDEDHMHGFKMTGKGRANYEKMGGRQNPHPNATGNLMFATDGYVSGRKAFSVQLELVKQFS
jgi:hypothetical protein